MDQYATDVLSNLLAKHPQAIDFQEFSRRISGYDEVVVFGCGERLINDIELVKDSVPLEKTLLVAADGAAKPLIEHGLTPHLIVSDLDGDVDILIESSRRGSVIVVHAHGDNVDKLKLVQSLEGLVIGSTQVEPRPLVYNFGGFTDGDRSVYIVFYAGYRKVYLAGFDFERPSVCPGKRMLNPDVKRKKLEVARWLISILINRGLRVVNASDLHGRSS